MTTSKLTREGVDIILDVVKSDYDTNNYYVFTSKYTAWPDGDVVPATANTSVLNEQEARDEMLTLKRVQASGVKRMIRRNDWASGEVYDMYDDQSNLSDLYYFVVNSTRDVYKCLDNNGGVQSTTMPTFTTNNSFTTADGYKWKYMFTVTEDAMDLHATANSMPVEINTAVEESAVPGSIETVLVTSSGNTWPVQETTTVIAAVANNLFKVDTLVNVASNYYTNFGLYVTSGGGAGFLSKITSYVTNASGYYVTTATSNSLVTTSSSVLISPLVTITGDGTGATAYSTVNNTSRTIKSISMVTPGQGYRWATATVSCNSMHASTSTVRPITSPPGGHGSDPSTELASSSLKMTVKFDPTDGIITSYRKIGVVRNPLDGSGNAFTGSVGRAYYTANVTLLPGVAYPPTPGETVVGYNGASATVIQSNTTYVAMGDVSGTFTVNETVLGTQSSSLFTLNTINNPTVNSNSGKIMFLNSVAPVARQNNSSEAIYVEIKL